MICFGSELMTEGSLALKVFTEYRKASPIILIFCLMKRLSFLIPLTRLLRTNSLTMSPMEYRKFFGSMGVMIEF